MLCWYHPNAPPPFPNFNHKLPNMAPLNFRYAPCVCPFSSYLYCGTPWGGGPYPGAPPPPCPPYAFIGIAPPCALVPPPNCCSSGSGRYLISCQKLHTWHPTSLYGFRLNGITGMKQKVNHSQRFITLPVGLRQFWQWSVMCSAPLSADVKARASC
jgi:hypothetical protein